jgi:transcription-repair coupling factor (superfamily II helicase)
MKAGLPRDDESAATEVSSQVELALGLRAFLPSAWIAAHDTRLEILRALDLIASDQDADRAQAMLRDRFGRVPSEAEALLRSFRLRARLLPLGVTRIAWRGDHYQIEFKDRLSVDFLFRDPKLELRPIRTGLVHLMTPSRVKSPEQGLDWLEGLLKRAHPDLRIGATEHAR